MKAQITVFFQQNDLKLCFNATFTRFLIKTAFYDSPERILF